MKCFFSRRWLAAVIIFLVALLGGATVSAADGHPFTLYFPTDDQTINDLKRAANDGGIGSTDVNGILAKTKMYTKGTKLGPIALSISHFSDDHDMPIYSRDYYCTPLNNKITTTKPSANTLYIRYTLGVALYDNNSWDGIVSDREYPTRVGVLGGNKVGTLHIPAKIDNDTSSSGYNGYDAKDLPIFGVHGDNDVRNFGVLGNDGDADGAASSDEISDADTYDNRFNALVHGRGVNNTLRSCLPPKAGKSGNFTSNYSKLSREDKQDWKDRLQAAGITLGSSGPSGGGGGDVDGGGSNDSSCQGGALGWILCPMIDLLSKTTTFAANMVDSLLQFRVLAQEADSGQETIRTAWQGLLSIANIFLVLAFLVIIFSQSTSLGLSNYGIKRMLPRLILAAILINLSFYICAFLIDISNIVGSSIMGFLTGPGTIGNAFKSNMEQSGGFAQALVGGVAIVAIIFFFLLPVLLAVLLVLLLLIARLVILGVLIVVSPLAFAAWLLPNTESYFKKWWDLFTKLLFIYPVIMAVFGASLLFSKISGSFAPQGSGNQTIANLISLAILAIPLFVLPKILMSTNSMMGQVGGLGQKFNKAIEGSKFGQGVKARGRAYGKFGALGAAGGAAYGAKKVGGAADRRWGQRGVARSRAGYAAHGLVLGAKKVGGAATTGAKGVRSVGDFDRGVVEAAEARKRQKEADKAKRMHEMVGGKVGGAALRAFGGSNFEAYSASQRESAFDERVGQIQSKMKLEDQSIEKIKEAMREALTGGDRETTRAAFNQLTMMGGAGKGAAAEILQTTTFSPNMDATVNNAVDANYSSNVEKEGLIAKGRADGGQFAVRDNKGVVTGSLGGLSPEQLAGQTEKSLKRAGAGVSRETAKAVVESDILKAKVASPEALTELERIAQ